MIKENMRFGKIWTVGATAGVLSKVWGSSIGVGGVNIMGQRWPLPLVAFALFSATSFMTDLIVDYGLPHISHDEKWKDMSSAGPVAGSSAVAAIGGAYLANPAIIAEEGVLKVAGFGIVSEILGEYAYNNWVGPFMGKNNSMY